MRSLSHDPMTPSERRAGLGLASVFALRMLGMFLILPVFAVAAQQLPGGDNYTLIGIAFGAYGLTQAVFQIPFGVASDRFGRKPVIVFGLLLFAAGCLVAAQAEDLYWMIAGRILQGAGAISAAVTALAADLTRDEHRTKVMAMIGSSIGLVFAGSLVLAPLMYAAVGLHGIFLLTGVLSLAAIGVVAWVVPAAPARPAVAEARNLRVLLDPQLLRLNVGIFSLHLMQMAMFMVIPAALRQAAALPLAEHWKVYLPAVLLSFAFMVPAVIRAERHGQIKPVFIGAIALLLATEVGFIFGRDHGWVLAGLILSFFIAFNILEATLPSLVSRIAPAGQRGLALGVYNTTQAIGLFVGGGVGGWLLQHFGGDAVFSACAVLAGAWLWLARGLVPPPSRRQAAA
ncbi:MFS transporter [uncultured Propionivibrio sp.]|uniref:MFS transporter n=1 Tax=uncultured Propionivibrio sp. TaxID=426737 RepID=UPI0029C09251|nr:MFS transporter [uncultured Propionivibrio sp.]